MKCKRIVAFVTAFLMWGGSLDIASIKPITANAEDMISSTEDTANENISYFDTDHNNESDSIMSNSDHESKYEFADYVIQVPKGTDVHIDENNTVTISNSPVDISNNDTFVVYSGNIPCIYNAESVYMEDGKSVITTSAADKESAVEYMYVDETTDIDLSDFVPAEGFEIVENPRASRGFNCSYENSVIIANGDVDICDGVKAEINCKISDLKLDREYDPDGNEAKVVVKGKVNMTGSVTANVNEFFSGPTKITLGYVNVAGVGNVTLSLDVNLEGKITIDWSGEFESGVSMNRQGQISPVNSFNRSGNNVTVEANAQIGITASFTIDLIFFEGKLSASVGYNGRFVKQMYGDGGSPASCTTLSAYLYANVGASATFKVFTYKKKFQKTYDIYTEKNSPQKVYWHYEDGKQVTHCSRGLNIEDQCAWVDSYFTPPRGVDSTGWGGAGVFVPVSIFEYETLEDNEKLIKITGWSGNVSDITIPETIDGYTVVEIGEKAFENNTLIRSVNISDSVTKIDSETFINCTNLSSVQLSKNVAEIGYSAFANCISLSNIEIPKSLEIAHVKWNGLGINDYANDDSGIFTGCKNLKKVTFEKGTRRILANLFAFCDGLEQVIIPETVIEIGPAAFFECTNLKNVYMPDTVTLIDYDTFSGCTKLNKIKFSGCLTEIKDNAFWGCALSSLTIPDSVEKIGGGAFRDCPNLASVKLPKFLKKIDSYAFGNCDKLTSITIPKNVTESDEYSFYNGWTTTYKKHGVFADCDNLKSAVIENGAAIIVRSLFRESSLQEITIPDTVKEIQESAFLNCNKLDGVIIPNGVEIIDEYTFSGCSSLQKIELPDSITGMGNGIFKECTSLKSAKLPNKRVNIADATFYNCSSLESITLPNTVESIRESAFSGCKSLKEVKWSDSLKYIDRSAFYGCSSLTDISLPENVVEIGNNAFENCSSLIQVMLPNSVEKIGSSVFKNCESLESVKLSNKLKTIPSETFRYCYALSKVEIPNSVTVIESKAFGENTTLSEADFGRNITEIASDAFSYPSKMTFYGYKDTYPQTYADEKGIKFVEKKDEYGDTNGDGEINGKDIIRLRKYLATYDESTGKSDAEVYPGADTNGDGTINGKDLIRLRKYLADYDEKTGQSSVTLGK